MRYHIAKFFLLSLSQFIAFQGAYDDRRIKDPVEPGCGGEAESRIPWARDAAAKLNRAGASFPCSMMFKVFPSDSISNCSSVYLPLQWQNPLFSAFQNLEMHVP